MERRVVDDNIEGLDESLIQHPKTTIQIDHPKTIVNKIESPDVGMSFPSIPIKDANMAVFIVMHATLMNIRFNKVWNQIAALHGDSVSDNQFGRRMKGSGVLAEIIQQLYRQSKKQYFQGKQLTEFDLTKFRKGGNLRLNFD